MSFKNYSDNMGRKSDSENVDPRKGDLGNDYYRRQKCYRCNKVGHFARSCPEEHDRCYRCDGIGHISRDCVQSRNPTCYNCNKSGHWARNCPDADKNEDNKSFLKFVKCFKCNRTGHFAKDCAETEQTCYRCGKTGHIRSECEAEDY